MCLLLGGLVWGVASMSLYMMNSDKSSIGGSDTSNLSRKINRNTSHTVPVQTDPMFCASLWQNNFS